MEKKEILKEQHKEYADLIGIENLIVLSHVFGGTSIYIPKEEELLRYQKYSKIAEEYNGRNAKKLARKYHLSERTVHRIVKQYGKNNKKNVIENQISFFD